MKKIPEFTFSFLDQCLTISFIDSIYVPVFGRTLFIPCPIKLTVAEVWFVDDGMQVPVRDNPPPMLK